MIRQRVQETLSNMNEKLRAVIFPAVSSRRVEAALLLLRLFVAIAFIQHGSGKLMHPADSRSNLAYRLVGIGHDDDSIHRRHPVDPWRADPVGGSRYCGNHDYGAIFLIQRGEPFINPAGHSWENSAFYLTTGICLALGGAGRCRLDAWLFGRNENILDIGRVGRRTAARQQS